MKSLINLYQFILQRISDAIGAGEIPAALGSDIISAITALNTGMGGLQASLGTQVTFSVSGNTLTITPKA